MRQYLTSLFAARIGITQPSLIMNEDRIGNDVDWAVFRIWRSVLALIGSRPPHEVVAAVTSRAHFILVDAFESLADGLIQHAAMTHNLTCNAMTGILHPSLDAMLLVKEVSTWQPVIEANKPDPTVKRRLFPKLTPAQARDIVYSSSNGATWRDRFMQQTSLASPTEIARVVGHWASSGKPNADLQEMLMPIVDGVRSAAKRIARTEGQRVANEARMIAYKKLDPITVGYQIHATMDWRTRPHHAARSGTIYYKKPKRGQLGLDVMPRPPVEEDGTIAHNCRCWLTPVINAEPRIVNDPAMRKVFKDASGRLIPDPAVYADWFSSVLPTEQRYSVGARRFGLMQSKLRPGEVLSWAHFIDPGNGRLMPLDRLKSERPKTRERRMAKVMDLIDQRRLLMQHVAAYGFEELADLTPSRGST